MSHQSGRPAAPGGGSTHARRRPTLQDIATEVGVSAALVSLILRGAPGPSAATAARVQEVADRLGYRANRSASQLARRRTNSLGVTITPGNPYHGQLVEEIQAAADSQGYEVLIGAVTRTHNERRAIETLVDFRCEALILLGPVLPPTDLEEAIGGLPAVCVGRPLDLAHVDVVRAADIEAMAMLVDHLVSYGHTRIAHVDGGPRYLPAERRHGYEDAMRAHGLKPLVIPGGETEEAGIAAARQLARHRTITAVVAYNDLCALGVMDGLHSSGVRVPEDISVTGFDDDRLARFGRISLTTIQPQTTEQAQLAVRAALDRLDGGRTERIEHVVTPRLMGRGSTGPVPPAKTTSSGRSSGQTLDTPA
jgi:DNA-binding LacI/PurR family transcriptional regulator